MQQVWQIQSSLPLYACGLIFLLNSSALLAKPSFNCSKAQSNIEKTLCKIQWLGQKDATMATAYKNSLTDNPTYKTQIKKEQREWMKNRNADCEKLPLLEEEELWQQGSDITTCLSSHYNQRIDQLNAKPKRHGQWDIFSGNGVAFARHLKNKRLVTIYNDVDTSGVAAAGATTESTNQSKIESIKPPYVSYSTASMSRFGAYHNYRYRVATVDLQSSKRLSITDLIPQKQVLKQIKPLCRKQNCDQNANSLQSLLESTNFQCAKGNTKPDKNILQQFLVEKAGNKTKATLMFQNPCKDSSQEGFQPVKWPVVQ